MDRQLIEYLPEFMREFREIKFLMGRQQVQSEKLWAVLDQIWKNQFIDTLDEAGCTRWEKMLGIHNKDTYTLPERRNKILSVTIEKRPFTLKSFENTLATLCGADGYIVKMIPDAYKLSVSLALSNKNMYADVSEMIENMAPANLIVDVDFMYNQHSKFTGMTHAQLNSYTHEQLRSEVI